MSELLARLEDVNWREISHAYGPATNVPELLKAFAFGSHKQRLEAREAWSGSIIHQGTYSSAAVAVVPFLAEIILDPNTPDRFELIQELNWIAAGWIRQQRIWRPQPVFERFLPARKAYFDDAVYIQSAYEATLRHAEAFCIFDAQSYFARRGYHRLSAIDGSLCGQIRTRAVRALRCIRC